MPALLRQGAALVRRLLPHPDRQHSRRCALPDGRGDSLFHGPPGGRPFPGRGARGSPLPNLRTLRRRAPPADGAAAAIIRDLRASHIEAAGLVGARARPADSVLRRSHKRALLRPARAHAKRARSPLNGGGSIHAGRTLRLTRRSWYFPLLISMNNNGADSDDTCWLVLHSE